MMRTPRLANLFLAAIVLAGGSWPAVGASHAGEDAPAIRFNTLGYLPNAGKQASVTESAQGFIVVRANDGETVYAGKLSGPATNSDTGEALYVADFSALTEPGEYRLQVEGVGESTPFRIDADLYVEPYRLVTRAMYLMRCGTAVRGEHGGIVFEHEACHLDDGHLDRVVGSDVPADKRQRTATGGWHDAGDYNKYVVNAGVTVGTMLRAWHDFRPQIEAIELDVPESDGPLPDLLAEVRWELEWLLTMQGDDGSAYHKLSAADYSGYVMPEDEREPRFFGEWGTQATASFVAMMAAAARELEPYDQEFSKRCLDAARRGYAFLQSHPDYRRPAQEGFSTVGYDNGDRTDWSARLWAAAEMWEATGDATALEDFEGRAKSLRPARRWRRNRGEDEEPPPQDQLQGQFDANWDWSNPHNLGLLVYLESERAGRDEELVQQLRRNLLETADQIVSVRDEHGYARPLGERYFWGCNGTVARQAVLLEAARRVDAKPEYRAATLDAVNHLFGRNPFGRSFITGLGNDPPKYPHDRRSAADDVEAAWPGYLVGGPHPLATDWHDEQDDYRTNEIAINWNAALIYVLAACLDDETSGSPKR